MKAVAVWLLLDTMVNLIIMPSAIELRGRTQILRVVRTGSHRDDSH